MLTALLCAALSVLSSDLDVNASTGGGPLISAGGGLSYPEIALVYVSLYPTADWSLDATWSMATLGGGVTWHPSVSGASDILVNANLGYTYGAFNHLGYVAHHARLFVGGGYGYLAAPIDLRLLIGAGSLVGPFAWGVEAFATIGKTF